MNEVYIAGVGMTRFGKFRELSLRDLVEEAVGSAMKDAGGGLDDIGAVYFGNAAGGLLTGQEMIRGQVALRHTALLGKPIFNIENACASSSSAFHLAVMSVASGAADPVLVVGAEKMTGGDKERTLRAIETAMDVDELQELREEEKAGTDGDGRSFFMDLYAKKTRQYMDTAGATLNDLADVVVKNHEHASLNPLAQYRDRVTREEVLESRLIVDPLTLLMCSPTGDGAVAAVLGSEESFARFGYQRPVQVLASVVVSGIGGGEQEPTAAQQATKRAFEQAGIGPEDVNVLEIHDAAAPAELWLYEEIGLCKPGDGPSLIRSGDTRLGGRTVANPSGGLLTRGHPIGATGLAQISEIVWQLRGDAGRRQVSGAQIGLTQNGGGQIGDDAAASSTNILGRAF